MIHALALVMKFVKMLHRVCGGKERLKYTQEFVPVDVLHDTNLMEEREFLLHVCFNVASAVLCTKYLLRHLVRALL